MKSALLKAQISALILFFSLVAHATPKICTMTINSEHEREVLRNLYGKSAEIIELVPQENRDPHWLKKACQAGIECDVLLISGHFGGVFFGETHSTTLGLREIEKLSCDNSCPGIFKKPKDVFLMGCNTLATKTPDKRSIEQYVDVLLYNGFPRDLAEQVAFSRYSDFGMSISQIFATAFPHAERIHGFVSTSPLGKQAGPALKKALEATSANSFFTKGPDTKKLAQVFSSVGYALVEPKKSMDHKYREMTCNSFSQNTSLQKDAIQFLSKKENLVKYYEPLLEAAENPKFLSSLQSHVRNSVEAQKQFSSFFDSIYKAKSVPLKMRLQLIELQAKISLISEQKRVDEKERLLREKISLGLNFVSADQICSMTEVIADMTLRNSWLKNNSPDAASFLPRVARCFGNYDHDVFMKLYQMGMYAEPAVRREALRALTSKMNSDDIQFFIEVSKDWSLRDRMDLGYLTKIISPEQQLPQALHLCLSQAKYFSTAELRDGHRWLCYNSLTQEINTPLKCHQVARDFETHSGNGMAWECLTRFESSIHLGACLESASMLKDAEAADDVRWFCWSKLHEQKSLNRSECLALASSMQVQGNQFKANWNCINRFPK